MSLADEAMAVRTAQVGVSDDTRATHGRPSTWPLAVAALAVAMGCGRTELSVPGDEAPPEAQPPARSGTEGRRVIGGAATGGGPPVVGGHAGGGGGGTSVPMGGQGGAPPPSEVVAYAHTQDELHRVFSDGTTSLITAVDGCATPLLDIAMRSDGTLFAASEYFLYEVDVESGQCTVRFGPKMPNSLDFLPAGVLGDEEALVGYVGGVYVRVDLDAGELHTLGELGVPSWVSSGDVAWLDESLWLTVTGDGCDDCVVRVDPATGAYVATAGPIGPSLFGLAAWDDHLYAFTGEGLVLKVDPFDPQVEAVDGPPWFGATSVP